MARPFEDIKNVNDSKELWKLVVRIHHKWTVISKNKEHFEMLLVDKQGSDIHCRVPISFKQSFDTLLKVNNTYTMTNFHVSLNESMFKPSEHKFILSFTGGTSVTDMNKHEIPAKPLIFKPFTDILAGNWKRDMLIDVIGMVANVTFKQFNNSEKKHQMNLILKDLGNNILNCTLWDDYATQLNDYISSRKDLALPTVIVLQFARIKEAGKFPICVSNTFNVTKLRINEDIPEIQSFLESIARNGMADHSSQSVNTLSQASGSTPLSPYDKFMYKAIVLPLSDIVKLKAETQCVTVATIDKLKASQGGWYYKAFHACPRVAKGDKPPYECTAGHKTGTEIYRYKIVVDVKHDGCETAFVLWDRECLQLLEISSAQMRTNLIKAGVTDPLEFPLALDSLVGLTLTFKVKNQLTWNNATVVSIYQDKGVIKQLTESLTTNVQLTPSIAAASSIEPPPSLVRNINTMNNVEHDLDVIASEEWNLVDDLDVTSEHNPLPSTPSTSSKRIAPRFSGGDVVSSDLLEGEGSSTKLKKIIKLENK